MAIHVGIIDQDPVRLVTPLLDHRTVSRHIIFIGDHTQTVIYQRLSDVLNKRNISTDFFEIPAGSNTSAIKSAIRELAETLKARGEEVKFNASCGFTPPLAVGLRSVSQLPLANFCRRTQ